MDIKNIKDIKLNPNDLMGNIINTFISAHEASRITKFNRGNISTACRIGCMFYNSYWKYA